MPDGIVERMAKKVPLGTPDTVAPVFPLRGAFGANRGLCELQKAFTLRGIS